MRELTMYVPTYLKGEFRVGEPPDDGDAPDFGDPPVPVVIRDCDGVRIVLGTHDYWDTNAPDVQIERQPGGWAIFLHPVGGSDASGYVYFLDNGLSYISPEHGYGPTPPIVLLRDGDPLHRLDDPQSHAAQPALKPCELCGARPEDQMDDWSDICPDCDKFVTRYLNFKNLPLSDRNTAIAFLKMDPEPRPPPRTTSGTGSRRSGC